MEASAQQAAQDSASDSDQQRDPSCEVHAQQPTGAPPGQGGGTMYDLRNATFEGPTVVCATGPVLQVSGNAQVTAIFESEAAAGSGRSTKVPQALKTPPLPHHFIERRLISDATAQWTRRAVSRGNRPSLLVIAGMPAIGKSVSAVHAAQQALEAGFTHVAWMRCGQCSPKVLLRTLLRKTGSREDTTSLTEDDLEVEISKQCDRWRANDEQAKILLLLDDLYDDDVLRFLYCFDAVLVTGGNEECGVHTNFDRQLLKISTGLNDDETLELLKSVLGEDFFYALQSKQLLPEVQQLCRKHHSFPLGVNIIASILIKRQEQVLAQKDYFQFLDKSIDQCMKSNPIKEKRKRLDRDTDYRYPF